MRTIVALLGGLLLIGGWMLAQETPLKPPPVQPLPFSHKTHVQTGGLKCTECHVSPDPGEIMSFPAESKCMACHVAIAKDKPAIQKLSGFAKEKKPVPWVRVYQIPSYVYFSHRAHLETGAKCANCHGDVAARDVMAQVKEISMGACMECHRVNKASLDCTFCHELRQ